MALSRAITQLREAGIIRTWEAASNAAHISSTRYGLIEEPETTEETSMDIHDLNDAAREAGASDLRAVVEDATPDEADVEVDRQGNVVATLPDGARFIVGPDDPTTEDVPAAGYSWSACDRGDGPEDARTDGGATLADVRRAVADWLAD